MEIRQLRRIGEVGALLLALGGCQSVVAPIWALPEGVAIQTVNGYPMAYSARGAGPTIVLVHGVLTDYSYWRPQADSWSSEFRVVAVSLRHFYPEPWDGKAKDFTVRQHADDLTKFIAAIGGPVYLVGWSYGAHVAYEAARARPDLVAKLVLAEAPLDALVGSADEASNAVQAKRAVDTAKYFEAGDVDGGLAYAVDAISGPGVWSKLPPAYRQGIRNNAWTVVGIGLQQPERVTCEAFGLLKMPVALLTGELTTPRFKQLIQAESKCLPQAPVITIPKAGHSMAAANPVAFKEAVLTFLKR